MNPPDTRAPLSRLWALPEQILVATDLTDTDRLLPYVIAQAGNSRVSVTLVHAVDIPDAMLLGEPSGLSKMAAAEQEARRKLARFVHAVASRGIECSGVVRCGIAAEIIQHEIERSRATRLMLGTHRHGHDGQTIVGSVANALLTGVRIPILAIGPNTSPVPVNPVPRTILHPVSLKGDYRQSARFGLELARACQANLTLVNVMSSSILRGSYVRSIWEQSHALLEELIAGEQALPPVHFEVTFGEVVPEILKICATTKADLIVIGIEHDLQWWSKSNTAAYQLIAATPCPVLTVRPGTFLEEPRQVAETAQAAREPWRYAEPRLPQAVPIAIERQG